MNIRHIYWFAYFDASEPSVRYRALYPLEVLKREWEISYTFIYPGYSFSNIAAFVYIFLATLLFRKRRSLIVFQKIYTKGIYAAALKTLLFFRPRYTLYDIDDAEHTRRPAETIHYFLKRCAACSAGSEALVEYVRPFNRNVFLLTSPVIDHRIIKSATGNHFCIGWIGYYRAHRESLVGLLFPALSRIGFPVIFTVLGIQNEAEAAEIRGYFAHNPNILIDAPLNIDWQDEQSVYDRIKVFDVGLSPLMATEFNRSKSAFKLKQYMSCSVPVLGSSVGENARFLRDGVNGFMCDTPQDYFDRINTVRHLPGDVYEQLCRAAKATFPEFSMEHYCDRICAFYNMEKKASSPADYPVHSMAPFAETTL